MLNRQYRVAYVADFTVEIAARMQASFTALDRDLLCYTPICVSAGGTGSNFGLAAVTHFDEVHALGRVGDDEFGRMITGVLATSGARTCPELLRDTRTGVALYVRDCSPAKQHGTRLLLMDRGANRHIDHDYVERNRQVIATSDLFFVDGYSFLEEPRRSAIEHAMDIARSGGAAVAFDLVPHDAHLFFTAEEVSRWFLRADLIVVEVHTVRRVFGLPSEDEVHDVHIVQDTWRYLRRLFPHKSFDLRFGIGNIDQSLFCQAEAVAPLLRSTGYTASEAPRGFGDRLSAALFHEYLSHRHGSEIRSSSSKR